jgi:hypothetical protein
MADLKVELDKFLSKLGLSSKSLLRVRFGGVVGKQATVAVFVAIGLAVVSRQTTDPNVLRLCVYGLLADAFLRSHESPIIGLSYRPNAFGTFCPTGWVEPELLLLCQAISSSGP